MVRIAQLARASVCGTEGRGFEPHFSPAQKNVDKELAGIFLYFAAQREVKPSA